MQAATGTRASVSQGECDEAIARYEKSVLAALQDANDGLSRFGHQREHLATLQKVQASAVRSADLTRQRYRAGTTSLIDLLDTQRAEFSAQQDVVSGQAELLTDFVSLQKSRGLGWSRYDDGAAASQTPAPGLTRPSS